MPALRAAYYEEQLKRGDLTAEEKAILRYRQANPTGKSARHRKLLEAVRDDPVHKEVVELSKDDLLKIYYGDESDYQKAIKRQQKARQRLLKKALALPPPQ